MSDKGEPNHSTKALIVGRATQGTKPILSRDLLCYMNLN